MYKKLLITSLISVLIIGLVSWYVLKKGADLSVSPFETKETITNYPSTGTTIVAFGDSLIYGTGSTKNNDIASVLSRKIGEPIVNLGVPGNTSAQGLARVKTVTSKNPKIVLVLFGGNDFLQNVLPNETFSNLEQIIVEIQKQGSMVVLLGIQGGINEYQDTYSEKFQDLAKKYHTAYIPNVLSGILDNQNLMSDLVHPNDAGYAVIADKIYPTLEKLTN